MSNIQETVDVSGVPVKIEEEGNPDEGKSIIFAGCCCFISGLYCTYPECIGCYVMESCLCCQADMKCCKPYTHTEGKICIINSQNCDLIVPATCCKCVGQTFCFDSRGAFPCDKDVPCVIAYCGILCCANWACDVRLCPTTGEINATNTKK